MSVYIALIILVLLFDLIGHLVKSREKWETISLAIFGIALFLVYVLRDYSVGRDIQTYCDVYESMPNHMLFDASWTYMEWGYVLLMKVCSLLGFSFRVFLSIIYALIIVPILWYIKAYSKDITLSLVIFICFQFFVFSMSALRQTLAMSICIVAYMSAQRNGIVAFSQYCALVIIAFLIHRSAIVFFPAYALMRWRFDFRMVFVYALILIMALWVGSGLIENLRTNGEEFENTIYGENLSIGYFFFFMSIVLAVSTLLLYKNKVKFPSYSVINSVISKRSRISQSLPNHLNLLACCLLIQFVFQGYMLMRAAVYYQITMMVILPNLVYEFEKDIQPLLRIMVVIGMVAIFYYATLLPNDLDIVPYVFRF